jgi:hypothetical protein
VGLLRLPAMRSLAQTSTRWATYLQEEWRLHQKNCADSARKIKSQKYPELMLVNVASRLAHARSITDARKFLRDFSFKLDKTWVPVVEAVLDARIEHKSARNLRHFLQDQGWGPIKDLEIVIQKIDVLVMYCDLSFMEGRIPFDEILDVFASLEGRPKSYAFTKLIARLCSLQIFDQKSGEFWTNRDGRAIDFIFIAHNLLPKKWNRSLALGREFLFPRFAREWTASFVSAAIITLRQLEWHSPDFSAALLCLVITSADKFSPGCRTWKTLCSGKRDAETYRELIGISDLISAVFYYGMPNAKAKKECKKILVGSGFFSRGDWTRFKHDAPKWVEKIYLHIMI